MQRAWLIMGTLLEITAYADSSRALEGLDVAYRAAARVDSLMSLYRPESELVRINRDAFAGPVRVSRETADVIEAAIRFNRLTGGAFDVTVKPMMDAWGFYRRARRAPTAAACDSLVRLCGPDKLAFDPESSAIRLLTASAQLDFGGIAKGYAVDLMTRALKERGIDTALVNLGGNLRALGAPPGSPEGWPVGVRDPAAPDSLLGIIRLRDASLASSGDYEKFVVLEGRTYGHIIDPRNGRPVQGTLGTTVLAPDAMTADILSTALFVLGPKEAPALAAKVPGVQVLCVGRGVATSDNGKIVYTGTGVFRGFSPGSRLEPVKASR